MGYAETTCPQGYMGATFYVLIVMLLLHCEQVMVPVLGARLNLPFEIDFETWTTES